MVGEAVSCFAAGLDDGFVGIEDADGEPVCPQVLPDVLDWVHPGLDPGPGYKVAGSVARGCPE